MNTNPPYNEKELFAKIADGDEQAFAEIYRLYVPKLLPFVEKIVRSAAAADEIIQEVFLRLWIGRDKLAGVNEPKAWVFRIASNICYSHVKKIITERKALNRLSSSQLTSIDVLQDKTDPNELASLIQAAIQQLPAQRKKIYRLSREKGMTIPQIAGLLGLSPSTVKNTLVSSLQSIRKFLAEKGYDIPVVIIALVFLGEKLYSQ